MKNTYIATIVRRNFLDEDNSFFNFDRVTVGTIDEDGVLIDGRSGRYVGLNSLDVLEGDCDYAYAGIIPVNSVEDIFRNEKTLNKFFESYEKKAKAKCYYTFRSSPVGFSCISFNQDKLAEVVNVKSFDNESRTEEIDDSTDQVVVKLAKLLKNQLNTKNILDKINTLQKEFGVSYEEIEGAIEKILLQIEGMEDEMLSEEVIEEFVGKESNYIDINKLFKEVTKTLIAQDEPAKRVITEIARKNLDVRKKKEGILLTGPTGVGKTELMRLIAKNIDVPFYKIDTTQMTMPGYVGKNIEEFLWDLYISCGKDIEKAENAIIFFDEVDKKGSRRKDDPSGKGVLNVLLPFIEGSKYDASFNMKLSSEKVKIDTTNMIVVLAGAFTDVYKSLNSKKSIGFNSEDTDSKHKATTSDFVEKAMMTDEFMGRVTVVELNDLSIDDIRRVMLESDESAIRIQKEIFDELGVKLTFTDEFVTEIATRAFDKHTGVRGLNSVIDDATWQAFAEINDNRGVYEEVILDKDTVDDSSRYELVKRKNKEKVLAL